MVNVLVNLNQAMSYIEENLEGDIDYRKMAQIAYCSEYYFRRMFSFLSGMPLGEYIRNRRLSVAALALTNTDEKIIDIALRFGYESPDAFAKAFQAMYNISPAQARKRHLRLQEFLPMTFELSIQGGFQAGDDTTIKGEGKMAEIIKTYRQKVGALRFIGKQYGDDDRIDGSYGAKWGMFFENGWFGELEQLVSDPSQTCEDGAGYVGLMRWKEGEPFQYWVGMFMPPGTAAPEGFGHVDFPAGDLGICWVQGMEDEVYGQEEQCARKLLGEGMEIVTDEQGACWFFERYVCPRFTEADEHGKVILDIGHYVK